MYYFIIALSFLFMTDSFQPETNVLSVSAEGSVELPADIIQFNVNLNAEAESPEEAYNLHQRREKALVQLLEKYQIDESDIDFQPISISKSRRYDRPNEEVVTYQTGQMVRLTLEDFDSYEKIQIGLIKYGFDSFNGHFKSSEEESGKDEALKKAIQVAKEKARLIAEEAGVELGAISKINFSEVQQRPMEMQTRQYMEAGDADQLMKYDQTIVVKATIQVDFEIVGAEG